MAIDWVKQCLVSTVLLPMRGWTEQMYARHCISKLGYLIGISVGEYITGTRAWIKQEPRGFWFLGNTEGNILLVLIFLNEETGFWEGSQSAITWYNLYNYESACGLVGQRRTHKRKVVSLSPASVNVFVSLGKILNLTCLVNPSDIWVAVMGDVTI